MSSEVGLRLHPSTPSRETFLVVQMVKNQPAMCGTWARSLDWEDPTEEKMAPNCSILTWEVPGTEEPGRLESMGSQRVETTSLSLSLSPLLIYQAMPWDITFSTVFCNVIQTLFQGSF